MEGLTFKYLIRFSYVGIAYSGLQKQINNPNTIQEVLESKLKKFLKRKPFVMSLGSRTDRGVHAQTQYLTLTTSVNLIPEVIVKALNFKLPLDIRIHNIFRIPDSFNIHKSISSKTYRYYFSSMQSLSAKDSLFVYNHPKELDIKLMKMAAKLFQGENDFRYFCTLGSRTPNTVRILQKCKIFKDSSGIYYLEVKSAGFLKYMIRFIMQAIIHVGEGQIEMTQLENILKNNTELPFTKKAPPHGLCLCDIEIKIP